MESNPVHPDDPSTQTPLSSNPPPDPPGVASDVAPDGTLPQENRPATAGLRHAPTVRSQTLPQTPFEQAAAEQQSDHDIHVFPGQHWPGSPWPGYQAVRSLGTTPEGEIWLLRRSPDLPADAAAPALLAVLLPDSASSRVPLALNVPEHEPAGFLGSGTYGEVLLFRERVTGRRVAVKFFTRGSTTQEWQFLQAEVQQLARMDADPGIVQIREVDVTARPPFYIMTYAEHGSLADRLEQGPLPAEEALVLFTQMAEALAYVHAKGVRHCDLKPANILLDARNRPLIGDFGQAHLASDLSPALGTFFYMPPEQACLEKSIPDTRWDVYALGAIFYAMVTGAPPHEDPALHATLHGTLNLSHRLEKYSQYVRLSPRARAHRRVPGVDRRLADVIDQCLEVDPAKRLHNAGAVLNALERRARHLRRRPLLLVGLFAPTLLLLLMTALGAILGTALLSETEQTLSDQLCDNDLVVARLIANVVADQIEERVRLLEQTAQYPDLIKALQAGATRPELHQVLLRFKRIDRARARSSQQSGYFFKWTLANPQGFIVADEFEEPELAGKSWAWRDWFNGTGNKFGQENTLFPPVRQTHISQPYVAAGTDERDHQEPLCITVSTPIKNPDAPEQILGLLAGTLHFSRIPELFENIGLNVLHGDVIILNQQGQILLHRHQHALVEKLRQSPEAMPEAELSPVITSLLRDQQDGKTTAFVDPLTGDNCLAGYAPVKPYGWGVIVENNRETVLQPVAGMRTFLQGWGVVILVTMSLATTGLWGLLIWRLRREEGPHHG